MDAAGPAEPPAQLARRSEAVRRPVGRIAQCRTCGVRWVPRRDPETLELPVDYWLCPNECNRDVWEGLLERWTKAGLEVPSA